MKIKVFHFHDPMKISEIQSTLNKFIKDRTIYQITQSESINVHAGDVGVHYWTYTILYAETP